MEQTKNLLRKQLLSGQTSTGLWVSLAHENATEICGNSGFDWCLLDAEHGPFDVSNLQRQLRVLAGTPAQSAIRVPDHAHWMLKQVLDIGAQSILVPMVNTADQARSIVSSCYFPPAGTRGHGAGLARAGGYGLKSGYAASADADLLIMMQIETQQALDNIDDIAAVDGCDVVFIGPADLSADMGFGGDTEAPAVLDAMKYAAERIEKAGKVAGTVSFNPGKFDWLKSIGYRFLGVGGDSLILSQGARALATLAKG